MEKRSIDGITILTPKGYLVGGEETDVLERAIDEAFGRGERRLVINMAQTTHLNNIAIGILLQAHARLSRAGGRLTLCMVDKRIRHVFDITRFSEVFDIVDTEEDALATRTS